MTVSQFQSVDGTSKEQTELLRRELLEGGYDSFQHLIPAVERQIQSFIARSKIARISNKLTMAEERLNHIIDQTVNLVTAIIELKDPYTAHHQRRVAGLAKAIARHMRLTEDQINNICVAAELHDIGMLSIPDDLLCRPGELTELEMELVKTHALVGYSILQSLQFFWAISLVILQHHERKDGSGYPHGLAGDEILLEARVVGIADVADALSTHRSYRQALAVSDVCHELKKQRGVLLDAEVTDACLAILPVWKKANSTAQMSTR